MTILSPNIKPPPDMLCPNFEEMAQAAALKRVENKWFHIPEQELTIGFEDPESDDGPDRYFAWDNEREPYDIKAPGFEAQARPISVGEYARFLVGSGNQGNLPATWLRMTIAVNNGQLDDFSNTEGSTIRHVSGLPEGSTKSPQNGFIHHGPMSNNGFNNSREPEDDAVQAFIAKHCIRTVWGPIPLLYALDWPAMICYNDATSYADWVGGGVRIPSLHEVRSIHEFVDKQRRKTKSADGNTNKKNKNIHTDPGAIFTDLTGANVGLQNFHPTPVTHRGDSLCGLGDFGGAWEWTSSLFAPQPGFKPMDIYPGYSCR